MNTKSIKIPFWHYIKIPFISAPFPVLCLILLNIISGVIPALTVYGTAGFVDTAISIFSKENTIDKIYKWVVLIIAIVAFNWLFKQLVAFAQTRLYLKLNNEINQIIVQKRYRLEYRYLEDGASWDLIQRVSDQPEQKFVDGIMNLIEFIRIIIQAASIIVVIALKVWWIAIITLLLCVPLIILGIASGRENYFAQKETSELKRKNDYLSEILSTRDYVNERKLFTFAKMLTKDWYSEFEEIRKKELKVSTTWLIKCKIMELLSTVIFFAIIGIFLYSTLNGSLSIGFLVALVNSMYNLVDIISNSLNPIIEKISLAKEYIKDFNELLSWKEIKRCEHTSNHIEFESLEFRDVTFAYPNSTANALDNISFKIEKNQHFALVGANGSGKTTIIKLLIGLYDSYSGEILVNGIDIKKYLPEERNRIFSVVFQDFAQYSISLRDNIKLGSLDEVSDEKIIQTLTNVGLNNKSIKLDTILGKIDETGIDISGGEWQRIAMARSIISEAPVIILDEPTAAVDPVYESQVYKEFESLNKDKTSIFISHRLASTKMADMILVLDAGKLVEQGNHKALIKLNKLYAKMYNLQKSWYE